MLLRIIVALEKVVSVDLGVASEGKQRAQEQQFEFLAG